MTNVQTGLAMLDSVKAAQKVFTNYLTVTAICANYYRDGQSINDTLSQLQTITNDGIREVANEVAHSIQSQIDEGLSERTGLLLAGLRQLQQCWRNFNSEELEREIRDNLLTFQRDGLEIQYLHEINAVQTVIKTNLAQNDKYLNDIEGWGNESDGEIWMFCEIGRNTRQRLIQVAESIARFVGRSMYKGQFIESTSTDQEPEPAESDKELSAPQQLLFIRLLQRSGLFPEKPDNTDDAPELRAIALLTGLDYKNDIKGGKGANVKVNQFLDPRERRALTPQQIPQKLADLNAVENIARLLNVEPVISSIQLIRADLEKLRRS